MLNTGHFTLLFLDLYKHSQQLHQTKRYSYSSTEGYGMGHRQYDNWGDSENLAIVTCMMFLLPFSATVSNVNNWKFILHDESIWSHCGTSKQLVNSHHFVLFICFAQLSALHTAAFGCLKNCCRYCLKSRGVIQECIPPQARIEMLWLFSKEKIQIF